MLDFRMADGELSQEDVFRSWVLRETRKDHYPDADPDEWENNRLIRELEDSFDEPAEAAARGSPDWFSVTVDGRNIGKFDAFPACGWDELSNDGTIGDAVDRLQAESLEDEFPKAVSKISEFKDLYPEHEFGGIVARHYDGEWPPVLLEGNHRACAAHWAARRGDDVEIEVHLGVVQELSGLPLHRK